MADRLTIDVGGNESVTGIAYGAESHSRAHATLVLAHGAGAGQLSPFMVRFARGLSSRGIDVLTFNFVYTEQRRRAPDRTDKLEACYRAAVEVARTHPPFTGNVMFIGGKSMGGRIATHLAAAAEPHLDGVIALGYPLHPPGKPEQLRTAHLGNIRVPILIVQGSRDPFAAPAELHAAFDRFGAQATLHIIEKGDHSLAVPKSHSPSTDRIYEEIQDLMVSWINRIRSRSLPQ